MIYPQLGIGVVPLPSLSFLRKNAAGRLLWLGGAAARNTIPSFCTDDIRASPLLYSTSSLGTHGPNVQRPPTPGKAGRTSQPLQRQADQSRALSQLIVASNGQPHPAAIGTETRNKGCWGMGGGLKPTYPRIFFVGKTGKRLTFTDAVCHETGRA